MAKSSSSHVASKPAVHKAAPASYNHVAKSSPARPVHSSTASVHKITNHTTAKTNIASVRGAAHLTKNVGFSGGNRLGHGGYGTGVFGGFGSGYSVYGLSGSGYSTSADFGYAPYYEVGSVYPAYQTGYYSAGYQTSPPSYLPPTYNVSYYSSPGYLPVNDGVQASVGCCCGGYRPLNPNAVGYFSTTEPPTGGGGL
jgi:hypothetical protein